MLTRMSDPMQQPAPIRAAVNEFLTTVFGGADKSSHKSWLRFWNRVSKLEDGEIIKITHEQPRSAPYHRRHFGMMNQVFDHQEQFTNAEQFHNWLKIGAGHVVWAVGDHGQSVPVPKSISYSQADQEAFEAFHESTIEFLRGAHAQTFLWPNLSGRDRAEMVDVLLTERGK